MQHRLKYIILTLLLAACACLPASAQSDSQTLRSPYASLVAIADFDFGFPVGSGRSYPLSLGGNLIAGAQLNRLATVGIGIGLQGYGPSDMVLLPVFADARLHFPQKKWTPYLVLDIGYAFSLDSAERGGFLLNPSVGGRFPLSDKTALSAGIGLRVQQNQARVDGVLDDFVPSYLSLKVGVVVKLPRFSRHLFNKTINRRMKDKEKKK
jgi:hypothetical protein